MNSIFLGRKLTDISHEKETEWRVRWCQQHGFSTSSPPLSDVFFRARSVVSSVWLFFNVWKVGGQVEMRGRYEPTKKIGGGSLKLRWTSFFYGYSQPTAPRNVLRPRNDDAWWRAYNHWFPPLFMPTAPLATPGVLWFFVQPCHGVGWGGC